MRSRTGSRSFRASSGSRSAEQLHRALEVGEEHGDLLALALEGALRGEDLLGEVLGGVGLGRSEAGDRRGRCGGVAARGAPQLSQNLLPASTLAPQAAQTAGNVAPHSRQNRAPVAVGGLAPGTRHGRGGSPPP